MPRGSSAWKSTYCRTWWSNLLLRRRHSLASHSDSEFSVLHSIQLCWHCSSVRWQFTPCRRIQSQRLGCILLSDPRRLSLRSESGTPQSGDYRWTQSCQGRHGQKQKMQRWFVKDGKCHVRNSATYKGISPVLCWRDICLAVTTKTSVISTDYTLLLKKMKPGVSLWKWISDGAVYWRLLEICGGVGSVMCLVCEIQTNGILSKKKMRKRDVCFLPDLCGPESLNQISTLSADIDFFNILAGHLIHKHTVNKIEFMADFGATKISFN